jgi:hypothetical protein
MATFQLCGSEDGVYAVGTAPGAPCVAGRLCAVKVRLPVFDCTLDLNEREILFQSSIHQVWQLGVGSEPQRNQLGCRQQCEFRALTEPFETNVHLQANDAVLEANGISTADQSQYDRGKRKGDKTKHFKRCVAEASKTNRSSAMTAGSPATGVMVGK